MIYQHVNKRAKILPLATFHIALYANSSIRFALPISLPRFKSIIFYQYSPKIKLFLKKNAKFSSAGGSAPQTPVPPAAGGFASRPPIASGCWGLRPKTPKSAPQLRISSYVPTTLCTVYNHMDFCSFCFEQFFLHRSVANLMMLTIDICLIVCCLKSLICITHCVTLTPSCYITLSYLYAKV